MLSLCDVAVCELGNNSCDDDLQLKLSKSVEARSGRDSPFALPHQNQGYEWPSVYEEIDEMIESCSLISPLSCLLSGPSPQDPSNPKPSRLPLTHIAILSMLSKSTNENWKEAKTVLDDRVRFSPTTITEIEKGLDGVVYTIAVNHQRKRVTLCFEGSEVLLDRMLNAPSFMVNCSNPAKKFNSEVNDSIDMHNVLHSFLFDPNSQQKLGPTGKVLSKYQETLYNHVVPLLRDYPFYKLYVTGHGFGGALATGFGLFAAAEPDTLVPKPVTIVSIGSPYVGDLQFRAAHQSLERWGMLRHIRVSNHQDMATLTPQVTPLGAQWFKHVGVNVRLFEGYYPAEFSYPRVGVGFPWKYLDELARGWDQSIITNWPLNSRSALGHHGIGVYLERLRRNELDLAALYLNQVYVCPTIVGYFFAENDS